MRLPTAGTGRNTVLAGAVVLSLAGCGAKPGPLPPAQSASTLPADVLALSGRDTLTLARFDNAARQAGVPSRGNGTQTIAFWDEFVRYSLESQAAQDAGLTRDSVRLRRWSSIRERILTDRYAQEIAQAQFGYTDRFLDSLIARDTSFAKVSRDSVRIRMARKLVLSAVKYDSVQKANIGLFRRPDSTITPLDSSRTRIEALVLNQRSQQEMSGLHERLRSSYKVEIPKVERPAVPKDSLEAFYRKNRDRWTGAPLYMLSALGSKDSAALRTAVLGKKKLASKDAFQALSSRFPVGMPNAPKGELGRVKRNFALPYGLGLIPDLFAALDTAKPGVVGLVRGDSLWYAFWYEKRDTATIRPFDQVIEDVRSQFVIENVWTPPSAAIVARWDRGVLFTKADVDFVAEEVPAHMKRQFPFERVLDFMVRWKVSARASAEAGLLARPAVQSVLRDNESVYWSQAWRQTKDAASFLQKDSVLSSSWKNGKSLFPTGQIEDSGAGVNRDAARLGVMPNGFLKERYLLRPDAWMQDSVLPSFEAVSGRIFRESRQDLDQLGRARLDSVLKARYGYKALELAPKPQVYRTLSEMFDSARVAYDRRDLEAAEALYRRIELEYPKGDTLFDKSLFQMGQLQGEKQNYPASLEAYRKLLMLRPGSPEAYKAQFMIAFTYSEYLKKEKLALAEYRKVLVNYPSCELAKDADWMIRNIESGGALMPKFDDSAIVVDSSKKAPVDSAPKTAPKVETKPVAKDVPAQAVAPVKMAADVKAVPAPAKPAAVATPRKIGGVPVKSVAPESAKVSAPVDTGAGSKRK
ncbi:MAG: hypothetical protein RL318_1039 [Fibrobacterota bacterium]